MAVKHDEFLLQYYKQLIMNKMPIEQFSQYCAYVKSDDLSGNMKEWKDLLEKDAEGNLVLDAAKNYIRLPLPDPEDTNSPWFMENAEWEKLFKAFQDTFRTMSANRKSFKYDDKANKFLDAYFGQNKLFSSGTASVQAQNDINILAQLLNDNTKKNSLQQLLAQHFSDDFSYQDLVDGIASKKYNTDPKFLKNLQSIAREIAYLSEWGDDRIQKLLGTKYEFYNLQNNFEDTQVLAAKITEFKNIYPDLLKELYTNSKAYDAFKANDSSKISKMLDEAKSRVDYNDKESKSYVPPKREDELSNMEKISEWWDNTYENYLDKYVKLHGDRMYFSPQAKLIVKAIDKEKCKPTDGLVKVLENASKIKDALKKKSNKAAEHFEWFSKTMNELKDTMPKAFAGALKNGTQMRAVIQELILKAVRESKVAEAKTAMEVLSVIKYGYTTSKVMDALGKENLTIFSDGKLSWNKNDAMKFVTTAMDKSIKTAFMGVGYGITMIGNSIRLSGSKFNGKSGRLANAHDDWVAQNNSARASLQNKHDENVSERALHQDTLDNLDAAYGLNENTIDAARGTLNTGKKQADFLDHRRHRTEAAQSNSANRISHISDQLNQAIQAQSDNQNKIQQAQQQVSDLDTEINRIRDANARLRPVYQTELDNLKNVVLPTVQHLPPTDPQRMQVESRINRLATEIATIEHDIQKVPQYIQEKNYWQQTGIPELQNQGPQLQNQIDRLTRKHNNAVNYDYNADLRQIDQDARIVKSNNQRQEIRLNTWAEAKDTVTLLDEQIKKRNKELTDWDKNHQDKYKELMAFWDFLETGRNTHTGATYSWMPGSKKKKQGQFDTQKDAIFQTYLNNYSMDI